MRLNNGQRPKILVTGAGGYIGSHAVVQLVDNGYDVIALDRNKIKWEVPRSVSSPNDIFPKVHKYQIDIKEDGLRRIFHRHDIHGIMHFAGDISVPESVGNPRKYYENNVMGTFNLLKMAGDEGVNNFIFSSSAAVYGNPTIKSGKVDEMSSVAPINPYGESKLMVEMMLDSYNVAYRNFKHCSLRYFNVVGGDPLGRVRDYSWKEKSNLFPALMRAYLGYSPDIRVFGTDYQTSDGTAIRDYIHVTDLVDAHILVLTTMIRNNASVGTCYNVGNGKGYSVKQVVNAFEKVVGRVPTEMQSRRQGDSEKLIACPDALKSTYLSLTDASWAQWKPKYTKLKDMVETYAKMVCHPPTPTNKMWTEKR